MLYEDELHDNGIAACTVKIVRYNDVPSLILNIITYYVSRELCQAHILYFYDIF